MANYEGIMLEKGMYGCPGGFSGTLEKLDPSENYIGTSLEGLDAYERQLKRFDIRVGGSGSDKVEKFFSTTQSAALFPEYVARAVRQGMEQADVLSEIIASTTQIDSLDYRSITSVPSEDEKQLKLVAQGAFIPETTIKTQENLVTLKKRGRMLVASYEAIKYQRLDLFTVMLRQIGAYIARSRIKDAIDVIINGDGNNNAAEELSVSSPGTLTYDDLVDFWTQFSPYSLTTLIGDNASSKSVITLEQFRDSGAGLSFHGTGRMITPLGASLIKSLDAPSGALIGLDRSCALELVEAGGVLTEYDKLIDRQLERAAVTCTSGFSKIFPEASKVLLLQ